MNHKESLRRLLLAALVSSSLCGTVAWSADELDSAKAALNAGKVSEAVIQLKNALQKNPENAQARLLLGRIYLAAGDASSAEKEFRRVSSLGIAPSEWRFPLVESLLAQGRSEEALRELAAQTGGDAKEQAEAAALRGLAQLGLGQSMEARASFDSSLALDGENRHARIGRARLLIAERKLDEARQELDQVLAKKENDSEARVIRGEVRRQSGDVKGAAEDFQHVLDREPTNLRAVVGMGFLRLTQQEPEKVGQIISRLPGKLKELPPIQYLLAVAEFQQGHSETATEHLHKVLRVAPEHLQSQVLMGVLGYTRGDDLLAEEYLGRAYHRLPGNVQVGKLLAAVQARLKRYEEAKGILEKLREQHPNDAQLLSMLGSLYLQTGDNVEGSELLAKAVEMDPEQATLRTQLALGLLASGKTDSAISELETAVDMGQDVMQADVMLVLSHIRKSDFDAALKVAQAMETRQPDSPIPYNLTGLAYMAKKDYAAADERFLLALEKDPKFVVALTNRAKLEMAAGRPEQARLRYQELLQQDPGNLGALLALASIAEQSGDKAGALAWVDKAHAAQPAALEPVLLLAEHHLQRNEPLKALALLNELPPAQAENPGVLRARGMAQIAQGDFASAQRTLETLTEKLPEAIEAYFQLGRARIGAGDLAGARKSLQKAVDLDPEIKVPLVHLALGELLVRDGDADAAVKIADRVAAKQPELAQAYELRGAAYQAKGDIQSVVKAYEKVMALQPSAQRMNLLVRAHLAAGQAEQALKVMAEWMQQHPEDAASGATYGMLLQQLGRNEDAVKAYEGSLAQFPNNPVVANNLAWLYHQLGDKRALEVAKNAYELAPERAEIVDTYGWILLEAGQQAKALPVLQQALVSAPNNPEINLHVAQALVKLNRAQEAKPLLQRVVSEHAGSPFAKEAKGLLDKIN